MEVMKLLEYLQEIVETSHKVPLLGKTMVKKKELIDVIEQIINYLPDEFKKAQWICDEKERILRDAHKQADEIKKESYVMLKKQIENHDITREAKVKAEAIVTSAKRDAKVIRVGAREYADEILCGVEKEISDLSNKMILDVKNKTEEHLKSIEESISGTSNIIKQNIDELRNTIK